MVTSYINETYLSEPLISPFDLGFLRGCGVIELLRTFEKVPIFLDRHLKRLEFSANEAKIPLPNSSEEIALIVHHLLKNNGFSESIIRIIITKGLSEDGITPLQESSLFVLTSPLVSRAAEMYKKGIRAITVNESRQMPQIKTLNYFRSLMLLDEARKYSAQEVLYCARNCILEGTTCNFFAVKGKTLFTAAKGILPGITRARVLEAAKGNFTIELRPLHCKELGEIDEAFISSSIKGIVPIIAINDQEIGLGVPGPCTEQISKLLQPLSCL